jgi:hypothetical protein
MIKKAGIKEKLLKERQKWCKWERTREMEKNKER